MEPVLIGALVVAVVVAVAEIGDQTQLLAVVLATRFCGISFGLRSAVHALKSLVGDPVPGGNDALD